MSLLVYLVLLLLATLLFRLNLHVQVLKHRSLPLRPRQAILPAHPRMKS
jgi:hypothetical protein